MKTFFYIIFCLLSTTASTQQFYIKGKIRDEEGKGLQNASILLHSTGYKYFSGMEGAFGILSTRLFDTVTVQYGGYGKETFAFKATDPLDIRLRKIITHKSASENRLASQTQNLERHVQRQWFVGEETYASLIENQFVHTDDHPLTSITLHVDRASYSNIRRFLNSHSIVPPDAVRIDEMLNYFNFNYTEPPGDQLFLIQSIFTDCPWNRKNKLLFIQVNARKLNYDSIPPTHLVFLIDISGSMDLPNRLPLLKSGFKLLVNNLREMDSVSIVTYGGGVAIALPATSGCDKQKIFKVIDSLQPGGSTPGASGIKLAYSIAKDHFIKGGNNRVILATDGDFNVGLQSEQELEKLIVEQKNASIYLSCLGVGMGNYKDSKIQLLAQKGNGNFAYIDNYAEAEKVLMKEFVQTLYTVADNALIDVGISSPGVKKYRLIGYDNKYKAVKDSTSVVEGGEIGSGYSNLIAIEVVPADQTQKELEVKYKLHYRLPNTDHVRSDELNALVPHTPLDSISKSYRLASAVIMFGGQLKRSKHISASWSQIAQIAKSAVNEDHYSESEFLLLIEQAKKIYSRKKMK